jgi:hypothetical protein
MRGGFSFRITAMWAAALICIAAPLAHHDAFAGLGAHYLGHSARGSEFRVYLDGGEFLGKQGDFQVIRVTVHRVDERHLFHAFEGCLYLFDETRRERDRLECSLSAHGPMAGAQYIRPARRPGQTMTEVLSHLVCIRKCGSAVPRRLQIEGADEDNG